MIYLQSVSKISRIAFASIVVCVTAMTSAGVTSAAAVTDKQVCQPWPQAWGDGLGPFDVRDSKQKALLYTVESNHFNQNVETLRSGMSAYIGAELHFVLHRFPNHPRALAALMRLSDREKLDRPKGAYETVECYLWRAVVWSPDDATAKALYGIHLLNKQRLDDALELLNEANELNPDSANVHYNLGLLFVQKKDYEKAMLHAKKAYALGFPLPGLKEKLRQAKAWTD